MRRGILLTFLIVAAAAGVSRSVRRAAGGEDVGASSLTKRMAELAPEEREALSELEARLRAAAPEERVRLEELARRYAAWYSGLPEARRRQLAGATVDRRLALVRAAREVERRRAGAAGGLRDVLQVSAVCPESIRRVALDLRLWFELDERQRGRVAAGDESEQQRRFRGIVRGDARLTRLRDQARVELDLDAAEARDREPPLRRAERARPAARSEPARRLADWRVIRELGGAEVDAERLGRFEAALPSWVRSGLDPLPSEAARRRLALLYRLTFPAPGEMP